MKITEDIEVVIENLKDDIKSLRHGGQDNSSISSKIEEAIKECKDYTDTEITDLKTESQLYTDNSVSSAKGQMTAYVDVAVASTKNDCNNYTDTSK